MDAPRWISVPEAAPVLGVSRCTLDRVIRALPASRRPSCLPSPRGSGTRNRYGWMGTDALLAWWASATAPSQTVAQPPAPRAKHKAKAPDGPVDWAEVIRRI